MKTARYDSRERAYRIDGYPLERRDMEHVIRLWVTYQADEPATHTIEDLVDIYAEQDGQPFDLTADEVERIGDDLDVWNAVREEYAERMRRPTTLEVSHVG